MSSNARGHLVGEPEALQALGAAVFGIAAAEAAVAAVARSPRPQSVKAHS